jgi:hypothetical protein
LAETAGPKKAAVTAKENAAVMERDKAAEIRGVNAVDAPETFGKANIIESANEHAKPFPTPPVEKHPGGRAACFIGT